MSEQGTSLADRIRNFAEDHRGRQAFGPNHPAVKAAKRYCERTGRSWQIGVGGRCELGKRAIKQWTYEATDPIRRAWRYAVTKWVFVLVLALVVIGVGLLFSPPVTGAILAVVAAVAILIVSIVFGIGIGHETADGLNFRNEDAGGKASIIIGWTLGLPFAVLSLLITLLIEQPWWWQAKQVIKKMLKIAGLVLVCGGAIAIVVAMIMAGKVIDLLITIGVVVAAAIVIGVGMFLFEKLKEWLELRDDRRVLALRQDVETQAAARNKLQPALEKSYAFEKIWRTDLRAKKELPPFDEWVEQIGEALAMRGYAWTDLANPELSWSSRYNMFSFLGDGSNAPFQGRIGELIDNIDELLTAEMTPAKRKRRRFKELVAFVAATLFMLKSTVCPNVDLPPMDQVSAEPTR